MATLRELATTIVHLMWARQHVRFVSDPPDLAGAAEIVVEQIEGVDDAELPEVVASALGDHDDVVDVFATDEEIAAVVAEARKRPFRAEVPAAPATPTEDRFEARSWLDDNDGSVPLAGNRFDSKQEASEFVDKLYDAGAVRVVVEDSSTLTDYVTKEAHGYSETLRVFLPDAAAARAKLFRIFAQEAKREGDDAPKDRGEASYTLWWD